MKKVYKICFRAEWEDAQRAGRYEGSAADRADGFIHLSTGEQMRETAARHFQGLDDLVLVAFNPEVLEGLRWEPSRGGDLFPHVYGNLPAARALWVNPLTLVEGTHRFPAGT